MQPVGLSSSASGVHTTDLAQFAWSHLLSVLGTASNEFASLGTETFL